MNARRAQVVVVGAGPAGMAAALAAADAGAGVLVVDEGTRAGGQIFRQLAEGALPAPARSLHPPSHERGRALLARVRGAWIERLQGATVYAAHAVAVSGGRRGGGDVVLPRAGNNVPDPILSVAPQGFELLVEHGGARHAIAAERLILCTGAYDRAVAFPGWTLPGVLTAGGVQVLVRGHGLKPGARAVVAGSGPLLLPAVTALAAAGVTIAGVFEAQRRTTLARALPAVLLHRQRRREAWYYRRALRESGVRIAFGHAVVRALGEGALRGVAVARLDRGGAPLPGSERELECDVLCTGFGLVPAIELALLLGCSVRELPERGGWCADHDATMATSVPGVYVAGETAGVGGADVAIAEGELAGLAAAASLGFAVRRLDAAARAARRERRAADALLRAFRLPPGLGTLATEATLVCRCEDVTFGEAAAAARLLGRDLRSIKMGTRAGMGPCQGRICQPLLDDLLQQRLGGAARRGPPVVQVPVKPVTIAVLGG